MALLGAGPGDRRGRASVPSWRLALALAAPLALALAAPATLGGCSSGYASTEDGDAAPARPRYVQTRETISRLADELMRAHEVTGLSLALVDGGEVVWATGFGMADVDGHVRAGPRTVYAVGSLAKPITAAAILQAVERGELELDQTLGELIPELALADDAQDRITLDQLLTHQSGLPSDWFIHSLSEAAPDWREIASEIRGLELAAPPGERTIYSNLGLTLAGLALERASGQRYEELVTASLLRPAGMRTAYFRAGPEPEPVLLPTHDGPRGLEAIEHAAAYRQRKPRLDPDFRMVPAGGLHASVLDLAAFARLLLAEGQAGSRRVLEARQVEAMLRPHNEELALDLDHRFGYTWFLDHDELDWIGRVASHGGRTYYHHAKLILLPDHDLAVAVASNSLTAARTVEALAVETLISAAFEKFLLEAPSPPPIIEHVDAAPELLREFLSAHAGDYATSVGVSTIGPLGPSTGPGARQHAGEVWSQAKVGSSRLSIYEPDGATVEAMPGALVRYLEVAGEDLMIVERRGQQRRAAVRLEPPAELSQIWRDREGRWELIERPGEVSTIREPSLRVVNGRLTLEFLGLLEQPPIPVVMALRPLDDHTAQIEGLARGQGARVEIRGEPGDERLWWAGRELRRVGP